MMIGVGLIVSGVSRVPFLKKIIGTTYLRIKKYKDKNLIGL